MVSILCKGWDSNFFRIFGLCICYNSNLIFFCSRKGVREGLLNKDLVLRVGGSKIYLCGVELELKLDSLIENKIFY